MEKIILVKLGNKVIIFENVSELSRDDPTKDYIKSIKSL
jgi:hypothetical protein